jgi:hypothetical protein
MASVQVQVTYADGNSSEDTYASDLLDRYDALTKRGLGGKALVHELLTDDWAAAPRLVVIEGQRADGSAFKASIYCF